MSDPHLSSAASRSSGRGSLFRGLSVLDRSIAWFEAKVLLASVLLIFFPQIALFLRDLAFR